MNRFQFTLFSYTLLTLFLFIFLLVSPAQAADDIYRLVRIPDAQLTSAKEVFILDSRIDDEIYRVRYKSNAPQLLPAGVEEVTISEEFKATRLLLEMSRSEISETKNLVIALPLTMTASEINDFVSEYEDTLSNSEVVYGNRINATIPLQALKPLLSDSRVVSLELQRPRRLHNKTAARLSLVNKVHNNFGYTGTGIFIGVIDGGPVYLHRELKDRVTIINNGSSDDHATHVSGTIAATGLKSTAKGMAPDAEIVSFSFNGDVFAKMVQAQRSFNVTAVNNSWGLSDGWEYEGGPIPWTWYGDEYFGQYSSESRSLDQVVYQHGVILVFSNGNDREDTGPNKGQKYWDYFSGKTKTAMSKNPDGPYTSLGEYASAKNVISVGAAKDNRGMTTFSSWGPTQDGRIKPEITANGDGLLSTVTRNAYDRYSGTSMAAPVVSGGLALVAESWRQIHGGMLPADVARALLAANAKDVGPKGPDYRYGFGFMDVNGMIVSVEREVGGAVVQGSIDRQGKTDVYEFTVPSSRKTIYIALAWIDPPASANAKSTLVNDLDIVGILPNSDRVWPYVLDPDKPKALATTGVNSIDNIELIVIKNVGGKTIRVEVQASRLASKSQDYAIATRYR